MWSKNKTPIVLGAITLLLVVLMYNQPYKTANTVAVETPFAHSGERLRIPSIGVDALIESVARTPEGAMDTPDGPTNVGWYSLGPYPGEEGSAVIAGHRGWRGGESAVFDDLDSIQVGDLITIVDTQGGERSFVVRKTKLYGRDRIEPEVFTSDNGVHLNLITCVGKWDSDLQSSDERLVVFADLVL